MEKKQSEKRKILHLSPFFDNSCGVGTVARSLTKGLAQKGHDVDTLQYQPWRHQKKYTLTHQGSEHNFENSEDLVEFIKKNDIKYDLMHFHNQVFADGKNENLFRHFRNTPKLTQVHCVVPYDNAVLGDKSTHNYEELSRQTRMLHKSDQVVHLTPEVAEIARKHYGVEHPKNVAVIHNSAEVGPVDKKRSDELKDRLAPNHEKIILYAGRLSEEKGILELAEGFKAAKKDHPDLKLVICGDTKTNPQMKEDIRAKLGSLTEGKDFSFEGRVTQEDLSTYYDACDFFIQPSRYEHFSVSAAEAIAHKKPLIVTKMDSIKDTFKLDKDDSLAIPIEKIDSPKSIAKAIDNAVTMDKKELGKIVDRAHKFYETSLTPEKITSKFEEQYEALIKKPRHNKSDISHAYIVPAAEAGLDLKKSIDSILEKNDADSKIIVSGYAGFKPSETFYKTYQKPIKEGKIEVIESEKSITKNKSSALNKGISEASRHGSKYATIVLPGYESHNIKQAIKALEKGAYLAHTSDKEEGDPREMLEAGKNPIHQSKATYKMEVFDKVGNFYDSMPYAEDMDFYSKMVHTLKGKPIKKITEQYT